MANDSWLDGDGVTNAWVHQEMNDAFTGAAILLVEDDDDIRELLTTLLRIAGFEPCPCRSAEEGLERLRESPYDLVLTDYALPNRTGGWLLQQAAQEGLLDATPAMVVTAHPNPDDVQGFEVIAKPFDLDQLIDRVRRYLDDGRGPGRRAEASSAGNSGGPVYKVGSTRPGDDGKGDCPDPVELVLYVSAHSPWSATAVENIKRVIARYRSNQVKLTICDLSKDPSKGAPDNVAFTPTLVKRSPGPRTFIVGHITSPTLLEELLAGCEPES
jgi:CheY-like chemotaxis protein